MCYRNILICLVGNKTDLESKRVISKEEGQKFADDNGLLFFETRAQDGTNIEGLFNKPTSEIVILKLKLVKYNWIRITQG